MLVLRSIIVSTALFCSFPMTRSIFLRFRLTSDKRIKQETFGNITDYSAIRPKGMKRFYAYAQFFAKAKRQADDTDMSYCLLSNIFAATRNAALKIALDRFADCTEYLAGITLHGDD